MPQRAVFELVSDTITSDLKRIGDQAPRVAKDIMTQHMKNVAEAAKPLCPIDPEDGGQLQDSIRSYKANLTRGGKISAGVIAGGRGTKTYAVIQHEDLTFKHTYGQAKFLERPFLQKLPELFARLQDGISKVVTGR